jgi:hypothetical protein
LRLAAAPAGVPINELYRRGFIGVNARWWTPPVVRPFPWQRLPRVSRCHHPGARIHHHAIRADKFRQFLLQGSRHHVVLTFRLFAGRAINLASRSDRKLKCDGLIDVSPDQNLGVNPFEFDVGVSRDIRWLT